MLSEDTEVWTRYLKDPISPISEVWYDIHVGGGIKVDNNADEITHKIANGVGRKRIDVVARVGGGYWVIELKPYGSMQAVGQIISYVRLFTKEYEVNGEIWPVIICNDFDTDLVDEFEEFGIIVVKNDEVSQL
jgi:hypothetical protein